MEQRVTKALLRWYDQNAREMPWREISDPYGIWVSEIMLQQTRVDTVRDYYVRFMARFPTVADLAAAKEEEVLKAWEGLGYYSRARNLLQGARQVMVDFGGEMPKTPEELMKIKGIGPYTSCSIASIAFGFPAPAVDGNVIRVISRLYDLHDDPTETRARANIERLAAALVPAARPGDHNQAMMDLGATVCVPGTPDCDRCPLKEMCAAYAAGTAEKLPKLPKAKPPKVIDYDVLIILSGGKALLYQRKEKMLQGLWCFPLMEGHETLEEICRKAERKLKLPVLQARAAGEAKHIFTHQVWKMKIYLVETGEGMPAPEGFTWVAIPEISNLAMPTAMKVPYQVLSGAIRSQRPEILKT